MKRTHLLALLKMEFRRLLKPVLVAIAASFAFGMLHHQNIPDVPVVLISLHFYLPLLIPFVLAERFVVDEREHVTILQQSLPVPRWLLPLVWFIILVILANILIVLPYFIIEGYRHSDGIVPAMSIFERFFFRPFVILLRIYWGGNLFFGMISTGILLVGMLAVVRRFRLVWGMLAYLGGLFCATRIPLMLDMVPESLPFISQLALFAPMFAWILLLTTGIVLFARRADV